jgi:uncharacterized protein (TIGR02996 family)
MDHRAAFLAAIDAEPLDHQLRCVFADWLDEQGEIEEADRQRAWVGAYQYLRENFVEPSAYGDPVTHADVMQSVAYWQESLAKQHSVCFGSDQALENVYELTSPSEFVRNVEIVTGIKLAPEARQQASFRCAC